MDDYKKVLKSGAFADKKISEEKHWDDELNTLPAILFSFAGICADSYEKAVSQIFDRVRQQCMEYLPGGARYREGFGRKVYSSFFLDIIEKRCEVKEDALNTLICTEYWANGGAPCAWAKTGNRWGRSI